MSHELAITNKAKLIGLVGKSGAGKTVIETLFHDTHDRVASLKFADSLKDCCSVLFSWPRELLDKPQREQPDEWWSKKFGRELSPRGAMQEIGTDLFRNWQPSIWVDIAERKLLDKSQHNDIIIISDCRFPNELELIRKHGGVLIHVVRPSLNISRKHEHESEIALEGFDDFDYKIVNDCDCETLKKALVNRDYHFIQKEKAALAFGTFLRPVFE